MVVRHVVVKTLEFSDSVGDHLREGRGDLGVVLPQTEHPVEVRPVDDEVEALEVLRVKVSWAVPLTSTVEDAVEHAYYYPGKE